MEKTLYEIYVDSRLALAGVKDFCDMGFGEKSCIFAALPTSRMTFKKWCDNHAVILAEQLPEDDAQEAPENVTTFPKTEEERKAHNAKELARLEVGIA